VQNDTNNREGNKAKMKKVSVGVRIAEEGLEFFGTDEVNGLLKRGFQVASIEPEEAMVEANPEEESDTEEPIYTLAGFSVKVTLKPPVKNSGKAVA
jgi:hypothetical protein